MPRQDGSVAGDDLVDAERLTPLQRLSAALGAVRRSHCTCLPVLALVWMHQKHPIHSVQQRLMGWEEAGAAGTVAGGLHAQRGRLWHALECILYAVYLATVIVRLRWMLRREIQALKREGFAIVAKTWCFGAAKPAGDADFYYGNLQRRLAERRIPMALLCGDAKSNRGWRAFARAHVSTSIPWKLPELCLVPLMAPLAMALQQVATSWRLRRFGRRSSDPLLGRICAAAAEDCLSRHTTRSGLSYWIGKAATEAWRPRAFLTLYEGHGWERCMWLGAKTADPSCLTVGYQHTVLFRHSTALLRPPADEGPWATPDVVLSTGDRTKEMMRSGHQPHRTKFVTFGTFRRSPAASLPVRPFPERRTVLVVPEGLLPEAKLLFDAATRVAVRMPEHRFIFRCHPVLPFSEVRPYLDRDPDNVPNIAVSDVPSIDDDFSRSSVVLYRGSSVVLYAVLHGLKPVYLGHKEPGDVDPLFELSCWRERAGAPDELEGVLRRYAEAPAGTVVGEWQVASAYVEQYLTPVESGSVERMLGAVGLAPDTVAR